MKLPVVALVGRPNVGKSTLFNKIVGKKISITEDIPGVTRDRIYQEAVYNKKRFYLIDTGGIDTTKMDFNNEIKMQAEIAINEADIVVFAEGWENARGCRIEHTIAQDYGMDIILLW